MSIRARFDNIERLLYRQGRYESFIRSSLTSDLAVGSMFYQAQHQVELRRKKSLLPRASPGSRGLAARNRPRRLKINVVHDV